MMSLDHIVSAAPAAVPAAGSVAVPVAVQATAPAAAPVAKARKPLRLEVPGGATRVLLHTCCAPCSSAIIECLLQNGITPVIYYSNSNIFPLEEYLHRKDECTRYALSLGLEIVDDDYDHEDWRCVAARGRENEPERGARCLECFKYRLLRAAQYASEHGFSVLTTTLASSRWKDLDQVNAAGLWACELVNGEAAAGVWPPRTSSLRSAPPIASDGSLPLTMPRVARVPGGQLQQQGVPSPSAVAEGGTVSQEADTIAEATEGKFARVEWWGQNWRKGGLQDRRNQIIKEMAFYNQQYCGCEYSFRKD